MCKYKVFIFVCVLLGVGLGQPAAAASLSTATDLAQAGNLRGAIRELEAVLAAGVASAEQPLVHATLGDLKLAIGDTDGARTAYDAVLAVASASPMALYGKAVAVSGRLRDMPEAIVLFEQAQELGCPASDLTSRLAFCYKCMGENVADPADRTRFLAQALRLYERARRASPEDVSVLGNMADIAFLRRQYGLALRDYREVDRLSPGNPMVIQRLATTHLRLGQASEAVRLLEPIAGGEPPVLQMSDDVNTISALLGHGRLCERLIEAYLACGRRDDAVACAARILARLDHAPRSGTPESRLLDRVREQLLRLHQEARDLMPSPAK